MGLRLLAPSVPLFRVTRPLLSVQELAELKRIALPHLEASEIHDNESVSLRAGWRRALFLCLASLADQRAHSQRIKDFFDLVRTGLNIPTLLSVRDVTSVASIIDYDEDGWLTHEEITRALRASSQHAPSALKALVAAQPKLRWRHSETAWLNAIPAAQSLTDDLTERIVSLLGPAWPVSSLQFQIVRYHAGGHYACHLDSIDDAQYRRPWTLALFLQAPSRGGELVFPLSHGAELQTDEVAVEEVGMAAEADSDAVATAKAAATAAAVASDDAAAEEDDALVQTLVRGAFPPHRAAVSMLLRTVHAEVATAVTMRPDLTACWAGNASTDEAAHATYSRRRPGVWVAAEAGHAVVWRNHRVRDEDGTWAYEENHLLSLHCGCTVEGATEKWLLNVWPTFAVEYEEEDDNEYAEEDAEEGRRRGGGGRRRRREVDWSFDDLGD